MSKSLKIIFTLYTFIVYLLPSGNAQSQNTKYPNYPIGPDKAYFKSYLPVGKNIATGPFHWNKKEWIIVGSAIAGGTILYFFDDEILKGIQRISSPQLDNISKYGFEPMGVIWPVALTGGYYIYGLAADNDKARQIALGEAQVIVYTIITTEIFKQVFHRHRPDDEIPSNPKLWEGPFTGWGYNSFPSRHTALAFATATLFQQVYKDRLWVGILSYTLATGVGLSRIYDNKHWPTDVLFGALIGYGIGKSVFNFMDKDTKLSLGFGKHGGVSFTYNF